MPKVYRIDDFESGSSIQSGHEVFLDAVLKPSKPEDNPVKVILKKNKHGKQLASQLEVAFSHITQLFLGPGLTPLQYIVEDDSENIWGLVVEHMCYVIDKEEGEQSFYQFIDPDSGCDFGGKYYYFRRNTSPFF